MTGEQILRGMTMIDEVFILEAAPRTEQKQRRSARGWLGYAAAACLCLTVIGSILWQAMKPVPAKAFEIEDGVLLAYHGTDAEVVIPDEVTKISASAFATAPSPEGITSLHIGENVAEIEEDALAPLTLLDTVTVAEENEFFEVVDGVLARKDGKLIFDSIGNTPGRDWDGTPGDVIEELKGWYSFKNISEIIVGSASIKTRTWFAPGQEDQMMINAVAVTAYGHTVELPADGVNIYGSGKLQAFEADDCFVFAYISYGYGYTYIFTEETVFKVDTPMSNADDYNASIIRFHSDGEKLYYERSPKKFQNIQAVGGWMDKCVSAEEFYFESGEVFFENGEMIYQPTEVLRLCDVFDVSELYADWCQTMNIDQDEMSLDEYLQRNAEIYNEAH